MRDLLLGDLKLTRFKSLSRFLGWYQFLYT
jgi:hypothetical protein